MQYSASDFRDMAREALREKWKTAILLTVIAAGLGVITSNVSVDLKLDSGTGLVLKVWDEFSFTVLPPGGLTTILALVALIGGIILLIIGGALRLGYYQFHQDLARREVAQVKTLFVHKDKIWHGLCLDFWSNLYIFLWTFCLIIPGIMAAYSYELAPYIANDHPELTAREAIAASKEMMYGHRWRLFCLEFSFIGWGLLAALTLGIGFFAVIPYCETAKAFFYQDLLDNGLGLEESIISEDIYVNIE